MVASARLAGLRGRPSPLYCLGVTGRTAGPLLIPLRRMGWDRQKRRMAHLAIVTLREMRNVREHRRLQSEDEDE
jgi:hypothetical protein